MDNVFLINSEWVLIMEAAAYHISCVVIPEGIRTTDSIKIPLSESKLVPV